MSGHDDRLSPATRNIVVFGGLFVIALALAAFEHFRVRLGMHAGRGETDSPLRLMVVGGSQAAATELDEVDGFAILRVGFNEAVDSGRDLLDEDTPAYAAAIAHADQLGHGFVALSLFDVDGTPIDWQLDVEDELVRIPSAPDASTRYVVFSVGDLAPEGPRMHWVPVAPVDYEPPLDETESLRLALYGHPDMQSLWERELPVVQLQGRQVLARRGLHARHETLTKHQAAWQALSEAWPAPGVIPGSLAGDWEQVRAAPIRGGVLLEVRAAEIYVSEYRRAGLSLRDAELWFLPMAALYDDEADESLARMRCAGLPEVITGDITVAPDGTSLILRAHPYAPAQLFVFDEAAARSGNCRVSLAASPPLGHYAVGRPNAAGAMAWSYEDDDLHWFDAAGAHRMRVLGVHGYSGPWWVDDVVLAMIADRPLQGEFADALGVEPVLMLVDTATEPNVALVDAEQGEARLHVQLDAAALFGVDVAPNAAPLLDLRPAGVDQLLLLTEHCVDTPASLRPCLHRLRSSGSLRALTQPIAEATAPAEDAAPLFQVETLGPVGPYLSLAISSQGKRAAWTAALGAAEPQLWAADLDGANRMQPMRVDADELRDSNPRISADGRIVITDVSLALGELGSISVARAFVLPEI